MLDLILQGPIYPYTRDIVDYYLTYNKTGKIIVSCWEDSSTDYFTDFRIVIVKSKDPSFRGLGNVNRQIVSSLAGLRASSNEYCVKLRTDQKVSHSSFEVMNNFYSKYSKQEEFSLKLNKKVSPIFVLGVYKRFAFHPSDHVFLGQRENLIQLFNIPHNIVPANVPDVRHLSEEYLRSVIRAESYLGAHYCANFDNRLIGFNNNLLDNLSENGVNYKQSLRISNEITSRIFKALPKLQIEWIKDNLKEYPYNNLVSNSFYYHDGL